MIKVVFKDLESSDYTKNFAIERIEPLLRKFPQLKPSSVTLTLSMENSPTAPGPDQFSAKIYVNNGRGRPLVLEKSSISLHLAIAELLESLLEVLNRRGQRNKSPRTSHRRAEDPGRGADSA